ncbi:hypothetical protein H8959_019294 [Pygathrix nigripes]
MEYLNGQDCSLLLTATDDGAIRVWKNFADLEKNPEMVTAWQGLSDMLPTTRGAGMVVDWEQETGLLMSSGDVRIVRIWDTDREMKVQDIPTGADSCVTSLSCDSHRSLIVAGLGDGSIRVYDRRMALSECRVMTYREHTAWVVKASLQKRPDGHIVSVSTPSVPLYPLSYANPMTKGLQFSEQGLPMSDPEDPTRSVEKVAAPPHRLGPTDAGHLRGQVMSIEEVERILDETQEAVEYQRQIDELLAGSFTQEDEDAILEELSAITQEQIELPEVPSEPLPEKIPARTVLSRATATQAHVQDDFRVSPGDLEPERTQAPLACSHSGLNPRLSPASAGCGSPGGRGPGPMPLVLFPCSPSPRVARASVRKTPPDLGVPALPLAPRCSHSLVQASVKGPLPWPGFWRPSASPAGGRTPRRPACAEPLRASASAPQMPTSRLKVADQGVLAGLTTPRALTPRLPLTALSTRARPCCERTSDARETLLQQVQPPKFVHGGPCG